MRRLLPLLFVLLLGLAACGTDTGGSAASEDPSPESPSSASASSERPSPAAEEGAAASDARKVPEALRFGADTLRGASFDGADVAGKPVVLWFWAPWCPSCVAQAPGVNALTEDYGDDIAVVGVGGLDDAEAMQEFAARVDDGVTLVADEEGDVWRRFGVTEQSSYVVLDSRGETVASGYLDEGELRSVVDGLTG